MDLTQGSVSKLFIKYLIPSISSMVGLSLYILFDTIFIGQGVGVDGLTALNITLPIFSMFICLGVLLGMGGATAYSVTKGRQDHKEAREIFTVTLVLGAGAGLLFTLFNLIFIDELCRFLGASERIFPLAKEYSVILIWFSSAFIFSSILSNFVRNDHSPKIAMIAGLTGNFVNIILDAIFIFIFHWGMTGAVLATVISPLISVSILLYHFKTSHNTLRLCIPTQFIVKVKRILSNGFASFLDSMAPGIVIFAFNQVILRISGDLGVAAYSVIANVAFVGNVLYIGTAQAMQPISGQNFGAGNHDRVAKVFKLAIKTGVGLGILKMLAIWAFPMQIIRLFNGDNPALVDIAKQGLKIYFIAMPFMALNMIMVSFLQSIERSKIASIITIIRTIGLVLIGLFVLPSLWGLMGVWLIIPFAEFLTFLMIVFVLKPFPRFHGEKG